MNPAEYCSYPDCKCPFDAPADPNWCARGFKHKPALSAPSAPVAHVSECEACMTPDTCQLRGTCDHYAAERLRVAAPAAPVALTWYEGPPPFPQGQEWFIAETIYGDRVVLRSLNEGREPKHTYDFKTADETYMMARNVKRWMQFPDCEFIPPEAPSAPVAQPINAKMATLLGDWVESFVDSIEGGEADELVAATREALALHGITKGGAA